MAHPGTPATYRKKPVEIEAVMLCSYLDGLAPAPWNEDGGTVWKWMSGHGANFRMDQVEPGPAFLLIDTLEGTMRCDIGDYIIRGVKGEFYPCKADIFEMTYEAVGTAPAEDLYRELPNNGNG